MSSLTSAKTKRHLIKEIEIHEVKEKYNKTMHYENINSRVDFEDIEELIGDNACLGLQKK